MLSKKGAENLFKQINSIWIEPEVLRRKEAKTLLKNFKLWRCLIKLPKAQPSIIEFNNEIEWKAWLKLVPGTTLTGGQAIYLHEVQQIAAVSLPEVNGERVAFIYLFWNGNSYEIIFDFTPNAPEETLSKEEIKTEELSLGTAIAQSLQAIIVERTVRIHDGSQMQLQKIGLWAAPALLPYPLSKIIKQIEENDISGASSSLVSYCTPQYIERLSSKWWNLEQFDMRKKLLQDALYAHKMGKYGLSIHALLPQVEGIITDWVYEKLPESEVPPWRQESKTKKFRDLILDKPLTSFTYKRIVGSAMDFILSGPVLATFREWTKKIDEAFPNRNVVGHGRYEESLFSEENSIKLFLLLDTVYHIISAYSDKTNELSSYYLETDMTKHNDEGAGLV
jgi:hypothetical protein